MEEIIDKPDFIKIKNFCSTKENVKRMIDKTSHSWRKYMRKAHKIKDCDSKYTSILKTQY